MIGESEKVAKNAVDDERIKGSLRLSKSKASRKTAGLFVIENFISSSHAIRHATSVNSSYENTK